MTTWALVAAAALAGADAKVAKDLEPFQGTWAVVSIEQNGEELPAEEVTKLKLVVTGNERVVKDGDEVKSKATYAVDATKTPKHIDVTVTDGPLAGRTVRGVYEFAGDTLKVCLLLNGDGRPDDFTCKPGSDRLLQVYKRPGAKAEPAKPAAAKEPKLREELLARMKEDQAVRKEIGELVRKNGPMPAGEAQEEWEKVVARGREIDARNTAWVKEVIDQHGWPGSALVGKDGALAAFLLVQHADQDKPFQERCLPLLEAAVKAGDAQGQHLAYLTDRVRVGAGKPQLYGTQLTTKDGKLEAAPIEDEAGVDARRKALGMMPLQQYLDLVRRSQGPKGG